jgi:hypothetical protein
MADGVLREAEHDLLPQDLADLEVDEITGELRGVVLSDGSFVDASRVLGAGNHAVIVQDGA